MQKPDPRMLAMQMHLSFLKLGYSFGGPNKKVLKYPGSTLGSPLFRELPFVLLTNIGPN